MMGTTDGAPRIHGRTFDSRSRAVTPVMPRAVGGHPSGRHQHHIPECHLWGEFAALSATT
jgi:hypothetical protein